MHLAQQVKVIKHDWTDYSGQALEHLNKETKEHLQITSRRRSDDTKITKKLKQFKDMFDELATQEIVGSVIKSEWKHRPNLYQRKLKSNGFIAKAIAIVGCLDNIAEVERAVESKATDDITEY